MRNAKVNGQMAQLLQRLGADEAPAVAQFFLSHKNLLYVRAMHPVDLLLRDAEKLRTEWATNRQQSGTAQPNKQQALEDRNLAVARNWVPPEMRGQQPQEAI